VASRGEDPDTRAEPGEIEDEVEESPPQGEGLGLVGQLAATLGFAAIVGLLILAALGALSWLFT